ncbi:MAG: twin-arginine translocation signal domain-containing protein [Chloroflexota bacterium]|nr:twin-arginine translocation signal domain-containing protein [Chloroflexota bacterium]
MKLSRRHFLKASGGTAAGLAAAGTIEMARPKGASAKVEQDFKIANSKQVASICPYCAVGCATLIHVKEATPGAKDWKIVNIEGHPDSPINAGTLCPKGAASVQLAVNDRRQTKVLYRRPGGTEWEELSLERAYDMVAERIKRTRDANWVATQKGTVTRDGQNVEVDKKLNHTKAIATLGGATMDNEWNYIHAKLMRSLGVVYIENQARI